MIGKCKERTASTMELSATSELIIWSKKQTTKPKHLKRGKQLLCYTNNVTATNTPQILRKGRMRMVVKNSLVGNTVVTSSEETNKTEQCMSDMNILKGKLHSTSCFLFTYQHNSSIPNLKH